jgi:SNF2 family DNA or RNA helicase
MQNLAVYEKLRSWQKEAVDFMLPRHRTLVFDEMGLGKTLSTLFTVEEHFDHRKQCNFLILCGKRSLYVWGSLEDQAGEIEKWFGKKPMIYHGPPAQRAKIWHQFLESHQCEYLITTYAMLNEIEARTATAKGYGRFFNKKPLWDALICDEIHENGLLNHKTQTYTEVEKFARDITDVHQLTGTPVRQGVINLFGPLHIVDRYNFSNYWGFVNKWCITLNTPFGKSIERRPNDPAAFRQMMTNYMIRRTKEGLKNSGCKDLPGKQRQCLTVEMTPSQEQVYYDLLNEMIAVQGDTCIIVPNKMSLMLRLRQLLVCPRILGVPDDGGALNAIIEQGADLIDNHQPFVIFTPFKDAIPFIEQKAKEEIVGIQVYQVHGGMTAKAFAQQWQTFLSNRNSKKLLICTIASGSSFNATCASYCFFLGYEWDFNLNAQSEDRLCRDGQPNFVNCYYTMYNGTVDEDVKQKLNDKKDASDWCVGTEEQYQLLLKRFKVNPHYGK